MKTNNFSDHVHTITSCMYITPLYINSQWDDNHVRIKLFYIIVKKNYGTSVSNILREAFYHQYL